MKVNGKLLRFILMSLVGLVTASLASAKVLMVDRQELIQLSRTIFVGQVVKKETRLNNKGNLIVTDYTFAVSEVLLGEINDANLVLTFAGGELGGKVHAVSEVPAFRDGDVVLLMLEEADHPLLSPVSGVFQGAFRAEAGPGPAKSSPAVDSHGRRLTTPGGVDMSFGDFVELVKTKIPVAKSKPLPEWLVTTRERASNPTALPSKKFLVPNSGGRPTPVQAATRPVAVIDQSFGTPAGSARRVFADSSPIDIPAQREGPVPSETPVQRWSYDDRFQNSGIVWNQWPEDWPGWLQYHDQYMMSEWNDYSSSLFRVLVSPTDTWAWADGVNDMAGFPSNQDMLNQFGSGWGATTLAICYGRISGSGWRIESDIAVNPAFIWTTEDYGAYSDQSIHDLDSALLHELGHGWGLDHNFFALAIMNYAPHKYFAYTSLYADDVMAVRSAYPATAVSQADIGVYLFFANGYQNYNDSSLTASALLPGDSFTVSNFTIENSGTTTVDSPEIDWYLVPAINSWSGAIYAGSTSHGVLPPDSFFTTSRTLSMPVNIAPGQYYLGASVATPEDRPENNSTWLDRIITVSLPQDQYEPDGVIEAASALAPGTSQIHNIAPVGDVDWVTFTVTAPTAVDLSTFGPAGDTVLKLYKGSLELVEVNDDGGANLFSRIDRVCGTDELSPGTYNAIVEEYLNDQTIAEYGISLATSSCPDSDNDGIADQSDNCLLEQNPSQCDGDGDGFGNHCDADFNSDGIVNDRDVRALFVALGSADGRFDLNCDGNVDLLDVALLKLMFGGAPGPSGLVR